MTFEEALKLIPTHIVLRPSIDKWQEGDEAYDGIMWIQVHGDVFGQLIEFDPPEQIGRRPIPEWIRKFMADTLMHNPEPGNFPFEHWLLTNTKEKK